MEATLIISTSLPINLRMTVEFMNYPYYILAHFVRILPVTHIPTYAKCNALTFP